MNNLDSNYSPNVDANTPGAAVVNLEPGGQTEADGINVPLLAVLVTLSAMLLVLIVVGLEAWFFNADNAERAAKQVAQGAPGTPLGLMLEEQNKELNSPGINPRLSTADIKVYRIDITTAIDQTVASYQNRK